MSHLAPDNESIASSLRSIRGVSQCVMMLALLLVLCPVAAAQNMEAAEDPEWHFRFELFQMLLEQNGLQSSQDLTNAIEKPEETVIVLMGNLNGVMPPRTLEWFCEFGGTVLLACDSGYSAGRLGEFEGGPVTSRQTSDKYQGHDDCLQITNLDTKHSLIEGVKSLVVNRSGWLAKPRWFLPNWDVVARMPANCSPSNSATEPLIVEVKVSEEAKGRLFLVADQSLFTNGMLWHGDNSILAINMSRLLCEGKKTTLFFVAEGSALQSYAQSPAVNPDAQLPENLPKPDGGPEAMLRLANAVLKNVETSNVANEFLANRPRNLAAPYYKRWVLFALALLALLLVLWQLLSTSSLFRSAMPRRSMKTAHDLAADRKVESDEFGMAASMLSRDLCREITGSDDRAEWLKQLRGSVSSKEPLPFSKDVQKQLIVILDLAINTRTVHITRNRFESIGRSIHQLRHLHQQNLLRV